MPKDFSPKPERAKVKQARLEKEAADALRKSARKSAKAARKLLSDDALALIDAMPRKKKAFGQNFLRKQSVVDHMVSKVQISNSTSVMEIGIGDGFLTKTILNQSQCKQLACFEIDAEWIEVVKKTVHDKRLTINHVDILQADFSMLQADAPWVLLANLPYQITFPILFRIKDNKQFFAEGIVMVQEEVAQKIVASRGRGYSTTTLLLQRHFDWELMEKVEPSAFVPAPKVFSRLLYFKPKQVVNPIPDEDGFWKFAKMCFQSPRQTIKNNLKGTHYNLEATAPELLSLRAQQLTMDQLLEVWNKIRE